MVRFARLVQATTLYVELPAMVGTPYAVLVDFPEIQVSASMRAAWRNKARPTRQVPEKHQILIEYSNFPGTHSQAFGHFYRLPISAHQFAAWGPWPGLRDYRVMCVCATAIRVAV